MTLESGHIRATFALCGDRYQHTIGRLGHSLATPDLASCEEGDDPIWPLSPPLQELHLHQTPHAGESRSSLLGVGMAGTCHWSLSVEQHAEGLLFDVAVRVREPPAGLGSTYAFAASCALEIVPLDGASLETGAAGRVTIQPRLRAMPAASFGQPMTVRWRYLVRENRSRDG